MVDIQNAKWISASFYPNSIPQNAEKTARSAYFRKVFTAIKKVRMAELIACALGLGVYYINGNRVTDEVLCTPYTIYDKRVIFNRYDVTRQIVLGENCVAVHVGNGFYNHNMTSWKESMASWRDSPKLMLRLHLVYEDGTEQNVVSDKSFKAAPGPALFNHMRQGEIYDARLEMPGFSEAGFCDADWTPARKITPPGGLYAFTEKPPIRVMAEYHPIQCENGIYDFGVNISGWVKIRVSGEAGRTIRLGYDEALSDDRTELYSDWKFRTLPEDVRGAVLRTASSFALLEGLTNVHKDTYILSGNGTEEWAPSFCYHGFRYVQVENAPKDFEITAQFVHTDLKTVGTFTSSDPLLNQLHEMSLRSTLANNVGIPTDCPHREQLGWAGDATLAAPQSLMNFDMFTYYRCWLRNYKDVQRPNGQLPCVIPTAMWGFNTCTCPLTDSAILQIPYLCYLHYGETAFIEEMWPYMCRYFNYVESISEDGLVEYGLSPDWSCSNLAVPCPIAACDTAVLHFDCVLMEKMAHLIGQDAAVWRVRAEYYRTAWRRTFLPHLELRESQTFLALALYFGMLETEEENVFVQKLVELIRAQEYHFNCGIMPTTCMFSVLTKHGHADVVYKAITNPTYPSYAFWVHSGLTTFPEDWDMSRSQNHQMFSEIDHWFYSALGGINYTDEGLLIAPVRLDAVHYVRAEHNGVMVERTGDNVTVTLPQKAHVRIGTADEWVEAGTYSFHI